MLVAGFTGTQAGMTAQQCAVVRRMLQLCHVVHHGDCIGADKDCHEIADQLGLVITIHPPENPKKRAYCSSRLADVRPEKPYRVRNYDIVDESRVLIATPKTMEEETYSGTWMTVRYARRKGKPIRIVWPDGSVTRENS